MQERRIAGIDLGGTKAAVVIGKSLPDGTVVVEKRQVFSTGLHAAPELVLEKCCQLLSQMQVKKIDALGVSCGGPLNAARTHICCPPNLPLWNNVPVVDWLQRKVGVPVKLENDADACALAEWRCGAGKGCDNMVFLTFGTGLGAGLILNGKLYTGTNGMAGEVGHIRLSENGPCGYGKFGSFEGFCSGNGLAQLGASYAYRAQQQGVKSLLLKNNGTITARSIAEAAFEGDETALQVFSHCGEMLGYGLAVLVDIINPERIVLGSIFARAEALLRPGMERVLRHEALKQNLDVCSIVPAQLGETLGDVAALCVAQEVLK